MGKVKVLVAGHGAGDPGAIGNGYEEAIVVRKIVTSIYEKLKDVIEIELYDTNKRLLKTNDHPTFKGKDVIEFHMNSTTSTSVHGSEVLIKAGYTPDATDSAILSSLTKYFINRGFKYRDDLYNMNTFASLGISYRLVETCFISSADDMHKFNTNYDAIINNLANALKVNAIYKTPKSDTTIEYRAHLQSTGWTAYVGNGEIAGTTGQSKRLEALQIDPKSTTIYAKAHLQSIGWIDYGKITKELVIGTVGEFRRLEAICLKGNLKYRAHLQDSGWTQWTKADGIATVGSAGKSKRLEAIQIQML